MPDLAIDLTAGAAGGGASAVAFGAYADRPAEPSGLYVASDSPVGLWVADPVAVSWRPIIGGQVVGVQPAVASTWTAMNVGAGTLADDKGALKIVMPNDGGPFILRGWIKSLSSPTAFVDCCPVGLAPCSGGVSYPMFVMGMRESATQKAVVIGYYAVLGTTQAQQILTIPFTNSTSPGSQINRSFNQVGTQPVFLRAIRIDGGTILSLQVSRDRITWAQLVAYTVSSFFTTAPDQIFIGASGQSVDATFGVHHLSYGS